MSTRRSSSSSSTSTSSSTSGATSTCGERGVAARLGVERRDPDQPVDAALGGEQAVGVLAVGDEGRRLDPRLLAGRRLLHLDLEAAALGPAQVHAQQHLGPVLRVGAAGAGADRDDGVAGVVLAAEQPRLLELASRASTESSWDVELARELLVVGGQLGELVEVGDVGLERAKRLEPPLAALVRRRGRGGPLLVVPEAGRAASRPRAALPRLRARRGQR